MPWSDLSTVPESANQAAGLLTRLDRCLLVGFGRLGPDQTQALAALARVFAGSPLGEPVAAAAEAFGRNELAEKHFCAIALARAAIQGAMYDALRAQAAAALGRPAAQPSPPPTPAPAAGPPLSVWQESARSWLTELALAGFGQLDSSALMPFLATLENLQGEPRATRLAAVLTGFLHEMLRLVPFTDAEAVPLYRWADLWTRSMLAALRPPQPAAGTAASGTFFPLAAELSHHGYFVNANVHGVLQADGTHRPVRVPLSAYKVDVVVREEMWRCFPDSGELLDGLCEHKSLNVSGLALAPTGDLVWGKAKLGKAFDWLATAKQWLAPGSSAVGWPEAAPADRHPVHLAEPVFVEGFTVQGEADAIEVGGAKIHLAWARHSPASEFKRADLKKAVSIFGLLRFDGGQWQLQPLGAGVGKGAGLYTGSGIQAALGKKKGATLPILRERAGKLLRVKS